MGKTSKGVAATERIKSQARPQVVKSDVVNKKAEHIFSDLVAQMVGAGFEPTTSGL